MLIGKLVLRVFLYVLFAYGGALLINLCLLIFVPFFFGQEAFGKLFEEIYYKLIVGIIGGGFGAWVLYREEQRFAQRRKVKAMTNSKLNSDFGVDTNDS